MDYVDGKDMGTVQAANGKPPRMKVEFKEHLLLEVRLEVERWIAAMETV